MAKYLGPAGIFSTDNEEKLYDDELYGEEWPEAEVLYGCCPKCLWWDGVIYEVDDPGGVEWAKEVLRERHQTDRPKCKGQLDFG